MSTRVQYGTQSWLSRSGLAVSALSVAFLIIGARWLWIYQHGQPLDIDEAGYLGLALADYSAWARGGWQSWAAAVAAPSNQAPLTSVVTSLLFMLVGPHPIAGFIVPLTAATLTIIATYGLGKAVASREVGLASSILVAVCPVIVNFSRNFHFSLPATLVTTVALLAIVRSRRFHNLGWALTFGLCLGLMPIARTMTIAFMPGIVAAAFFYTVVDRVNIVRRLSLFIISVALAACIITIWLIPNAQPVFSYLLDFGYGGRAVEFGSEQSKFGWNAWVTTLIALMYDMYLPHLVVIFLGAIALVVQLIQTAAGHSAADLWKKVLQSNLFPLCIALLEFILALTSSRNKGSAFFAPLTPVLLVIACFALFQISRKRAYRTVLIGFLLAVVMISGVPTVDLATPLAIPRFVNLPILGKTTISDGRGSIQRYEAFGGYASDDVVEPIPPAIGRDWVALSNSAAERLSSKYGLQPLIAFGFRNEIFNVNTLNLAQMLRTRLPFAVVQVEPIVTGTSIEGYRKWLQSIVPTPCALLTANFKHGEFNPPVDTRLMEAAAAESGFAPEQSWLAPDGRTVSVWAKPLLPPNCH